MRNLFQMDLYRLFHRKILYVMMIAMSVVTLSMLFLSDTSSIDFQTAMGVMQGVSMDNFMSAASGLGLVYTVTLIILSFFVCDDFSTGFAKNIFTVHANKRDYIASKILTMMIAGGILMLVNTAETVGFAIISGIEIESIGGVLIFFVEKWLISAAFSSAILFISVWARNKGIGFLFACLLGTGGLVMGLGTGLESLHIPFAKQITEWTIYGTSTLPSFHLQAGDFLHIAVVTIFWTIFYAGMAAMVLRKKDV